MSGLPPSGSEVITKQVDEAASFQTFIIDASVGVKWFVVEADSDAALRWINPQFRLHVPAYFYTEAASVFQRKVAIEHTITEDEALAAFRLLRRADLAVHSNEELLEEAIRLGIRYRRPVYDSLYLVLAAACGGRVVTPDGRLYRGVRGGPLDHLVLWVTDPW